MITVGGGGGRDKACLVSTIQTIGQKRRQSQDSQQWIR